MHTLHGRRAPGEPLLDRAKQSRVAKKKTGGQGEIRKCLWWRSKVAVAVAVGVAAAAAVLVVSAVAGAAAVM